MSEVAETILAQLGGKNRLNAMIGVKTFLYAKDHLQINLKTKAKNKADRVQIFIRQNDTYTVIALAYNSRTLECPEVGKEVGVYASELKDVVSRMLGLRLSL